MYEFWFQILSKMNISEVMSLDFVTLTEHVDGAF